jgi:hypothetical protein
LFSTIACAQYIPFYAKLTDGTGNVSKTAFLQISAIVQWKRYPSARFGLEYDQLCI